MTGRRVVPDASVAVKWLLDEPGAESARRLRNEVNVEFHVPDLWYLELGNVLWKRSRRGEPGLTLRRTGELLEIIAITPVKVHPAVGLIDRATEIAFRNGVSVYDAAYVAVAEAQSAVLVTADSRLARLLREAPALAVEVEVLSM